ITTFKKCHHCSSIQPFCFAKWLNAKGIEAGSAQRCVGSKPQGRRVEAARAAENRLPPMVCSHTDAYYELKARSAHGFAVSRFAQKKLKISY
ncbi:MAG: hypothetical protein Q4F57_05325, partial [Weeksellaceae bacterium]|nr:hypothetical protein [Weeksellaceae bacterium]